MSQHLFDPLRLRGVEIRNRIVLSPMLTYAARNGYANEWHLVHLGKYAIGGVGLVFVESTKVDPRGCSTPSDLGLWKDEFVAPLRRIAAFVQSYGAVAGIQLAHSGRKARTSVPWAGRKPLPDAPGVDHGEPWEVVGPSAVPHGPGYPMPRELSVTEIAEQVEAWARAAQRAQQAGFDVLEIHGAHGYLIHQFLSPKSNRRTDAYGGTLDRRMRFALEVTERVRGVWPQDKPLFFRISAVDDAGWTLDDSIVLCRELKSLGVDVIDCSSGGMTAGRTSIDSRGEPVLGYQVPYAARIRDEVDVRTMAVGLIVHSDQAERILAAGQADLIAIGRELLQNPHWVLDAAEKLGAPAPYAAVPQAYGYWLERRARAGMAGRTSTWRAGLDCDTRV